MASNWWGNEKKQARQGRKPKPSDLGTGGAAKAATQIKSRQQKIEEALKKAGA